MGALGKGSGGTFEGKGLGGKAEGGDLAPPRTTLANERAPNQGSLCLAHSSQRYCALEATIVL
jgi:hypothetical protein